MTDIKDTGSAPCKLGFARPNDETLLIRLSGSWTVENRRPSADDIRKEIESGPRIARITFDTIDVSNWDSGLLTFLTKVIGRCSRDGVAVDKQGLPEGVQKLLLLAATVPEKKGARKEAGGGSFLAQVGTEAIYFVRSTGEVLAFIGEATVALFKFLVGKASFRRSDLVLFIQQCGADALPIITLISLLVGLILAFIGAIQLLMFGAQVYVADLVGIAMVRVMGAVMVGIVMAGRTGAAFAAQLGTMQGNEEIDALKTMGVSPMEFLVLPRMLALILMMPLLCIYADLMGILGGLIVGVGVLEIGLLQYVNQTTGALRLSYFFIGIFHATVFGVLVALAGCLRGMQCGRSASAVGEATTSAVVTSIVAIIVATGIITVVCDIIGI